MDESANRRSNHLMMRISSALLGASQRLKAALLERVERGKSRHRHMELVESLSLGNRRQLFLVACDDHRFLIGAGADNVGTLVAMPESVRDAAVLPSAGPKPRRAEADGRRPAWTGGHFGASEGSGIQLVKRDGSFQGPAKRQGSMEAGRTQW